jgi:hypothetical protein
MHCRFLLVESTILSACVCYIRTDATVFDPDCWVDI